MFAVGCLLLIVLPLIGLVAGGLVGGAGAALWCALAGFGIAALVCGISAYALIKASRGT